MEMVMATVTGMDMATDMGMVTDTVTVDMVMVMVMVTDPGTLDDLDTPGGGSTTALLCRIVLPLTSATATTFTPPATFKYLAARSSKTSAGTWDSKV